MASESFLDEIRVASPCSASWEAMDGDERVRFCAQCRKNVYNLSGMRRGEAETLVGEHEGRLCVRYYLRRDGTVLTEDCPAGLRAARRWAHARMTATAAFLGGLLALCLQQTPLGRLASLLAPLTPRHGPTQVMGFMGAVPPLPPPPPSPAFPQPPPPPRMGEISFLRDPPIVLGRVAPRMRELPGPPER
jgi:hypothetical protein